MNQNEFKNALKELGITITEEQLQHLEIYYNLLVEWNEKMNLTGITEKEEVYLKHFYDSLTICKVIDLKNIRTLCDVGTGAGFPGMVLKIVFPNLRVTLVDSLQKRLTFLEAVKNEIGLTNLDIIHARAEEYARDNREKFDVVTARAVAPLNILLEYCVPMAKEEGYFIPLKANVIEELGNSKNAMQKLAIKLEQKEEFLLPVENSQRTILLLKKEEKTSKKFPRKYSEIKKRPL